MSIEFKTFTPPSSEESFSVGRFGHGGGSGKYKSAIATAIVDEAMTENKSKQKG